MHLSLFRIASLICLCFVLKACIGTPPEEISEAAVSSVEIELPSLKTSKMSWQTASYIDSSAKPWWLEFDDVVLHDFIAVALENAQNIERAIGRLEELAATAKASRSGLFPTLNFTGQAGVSSSDLEEGGLQSNPARTNTTTADFALAWQTDLFGELRNTSKADRTRFQAEASRVRDTQRLVVSQVVQNYYQWVSIRGRIQLTRDSVARRQENVDRINQLLDQGYATALDKTRTDSQFYDATAQLAQLELDEATLLNRLAVVAGISPLKIRGLLAVTGELVSPSNSAPLPSINLLIKHRPDLRAAERDLVAAAYNVNSSMAALYPTLGLTLNFGKGTGSTGTTTGPFPALDVITGGVLANLAMPILGRGRLLATIDVNSARLKQVHSDFELAALQAITELDTSIVSMDKNRVIYEQRKLSADSAREAAELSRELFKAGELDYTSVIVAEQTRVSAENNSINAKETWLIAYITYLAAVAPVW